MVFFFRVFWVFSFLLIGWFGLVLEGFLVFVFCLFAVVFLVWGFFPNFWFGFLGDFVVVGFVWFFWFLSFLEFFCFPLFQEVQSHFGVGSSALSSALKFILTPSWQLNLKDHKVSEQN